MKYHLLPSCAGLVIAVACFFNTALRASPSTTVQARLVPSIDAVESGKPFDVYVVLDLEKGWHTYGQPPGDSGFPPKISWQLPEGWSAGPLEFSIPTKFTEPGGLVINGYENRAVMRAKITPSAQFSKNTSSSWNISAKISWLVCSSTLCIPGNDSASIILGDLNYNASAEHKLLESLASPTLWPVVDTPKTPPINFMLLLAALGSGLLGGLILNLMPCVLPVISLKIFGFISQAGESRQKILRHGLSFTAGIYSWFLALGSLIVILKSTGMKVTWAFQFQSPAFLLAISILIFLFALNLFGVFEITLPNKAGTSLDQLASREGYLGSFFQGLFATLLATPCTAPFLGSALGFAFAQSGTVIMAMFFSIATGMALPYLLLSAQPAWMRLLPRPGGWMERMKQLMGFPLLATNLWLLYVLGQQRGINGMLMTATLLLILALSAWIYGAFITSQRSLIAIIISLLIAVIGSCFYMPKILSSKNELSNNSTSQTSEKGSSHDTIAWVPYSSEKFEELRKNGEAIFLDFTAAWCLTCQFNERTAINTADVRALLKKQKIVPMKADWTNANPEITKALQAFGRVGVPYYVFYPASKTNKAVTFSELLTEAQLIKAFSKN